MTEEDGQSYVEFQVTRSGVFQVMRVPMEALGPLQMNASGSPTQWFLLTTTLAAFAAILLKAMRQDRWQRR